MEHCYLLAVFRTSDPSDLRSVTGAEMSNRHFDTGAKLVEHLDSRHQSEVSFIFRIQHMKTNLS